MIQRSSTQPHSLKLMGACTGDSAIHDPAILDPEEPVLMSQKSAILDPAIQPKADRSLCWRYNDLRSSLKLAGACVDDLVIQPKTYELLCRRSSDPV